MKTLTVPCFTDNQALTNYLNHTVNHPIDQESWPEIFHATHAAFSIAHNQDSLFIQYQVMEEDIAAIQTQANSPVYQDSCVEFFIQLPLDQGYYNFEFNCIGTALVGYGTGRENREAMKIETIAMIKRRATLHTGGSEPGIKWTLQVEIPARIFGNPHFSTFSGLNCKANFYKCGDHLAIPHFLSWNAIQAPNPDFHLPEYFGQLQFNSI